MLHLRSGMTSRSGGLDRLSCSRRLGGSPREKCSQLLRRGPAYRRADHLQPRHRAAHVSVLFVCHRPGEAAPFSLLTYSDVKKHARQIADVTRSRAMPPWLPEPQELKFADELRLRDAEINLIQRWVEQGAVEGAAADLPPQPKFVEGWRLGKPDLILTASKPLVLPPQGTDTYWNFIFPPVVPGHDRRDG